MELRRCSYYTTSIEEDLARFELCRDPKVFNFSNGQGLSWRGDQGMVVPKSSLNLSKWTLVFIWLAPKHRH